MADVNPRRVYKGVDKEFTWCARTHGSPGGVYTRWWRIYYVARRRPLPVQTARDYIMSVTAKKTSDK